MKRISSLVLAAAFVFGSMGAAQAIDTKVKGTWDFTFGWGVHNGFQNSKKADGGNKDYFDARQRVRTQINFIASENLQAVLMFEIGTLDWGKDGNKLGDGSGAGLDADGINIKTRRAYLDWLLPDTGVSVRMGIQDLHLPMATRYANPAFSADVAGVVTSYKFDETFAVTAFWARPFNQMNGSGTNSLDKTDMFGLILPVTLDGVSITPWGTVARVGAQSGAIEYMTGLNKNQTVADTTGKKFSDIEDRDQTTTVWWTGLGVNVDLLDPLTFALDVMYGHMGTVDTIAYDDTKGSETYEKGIKARASGWFLTSTLDYKLDWGTPGLFGWWSTGDTVKKLEDNKLGRMPVLGLDDGFNPTSFGFADNMALSRGNVLGTSGMGTWGIGLQIADLSFIEDLTHVIRVAYITGTNQSDLVKDLRNDRVAGVDVDTLMLNGDGVYLTNKDHALEVNFISEYQIYENLSTTLDLSYINLDLDKDTWNTATDNYVKNHNSDAWKAQVNLKYDF